jgi:hypothetical protein
MCGLVKPVFRLPYVPLSQEQRKRGAVLLRQVQQHIPGCKVCVDLAFAHGCQQADVQAQRR